MTHDDPDRAVNEWLRRNHGDWTSGGPLLGETDDQPTEEDRMSRHVFADPDELGPINYSLRFDPVTNGVEIFTADASATVGLGESRIVLPRNVARHIAALILDEGESGDEANYWRCRMRVYEERANQCHRDQASTAAVQWERMAIRARELARLHAGEKVVVFDERGVE